MAKPKSLVLLSSGLDSTANLLLALEQSSVELALTIDYGQRAARSEIRQSRAISDALGVRHQVLKLDFLAELGGSSLTDPAQTVPTSEAVSIDSLSTSQKTAASVWVPNRNGLFLNVAASIADRHGWDWIIPGFNREEAETFPDNSEGFLQVMNQSLSFSTRSPVQVRCFTTQMRKPEIYKLAAKVALHRSGFSMNMIWPCYFDGAAPCGQCESCQRFFRAQNST